MWTADFWKDTAERAIKTFAQVLVSFIVIGTTGVMDVDWLGILSISGMAALASVLTSVASDGIGVRGTASALPEKDAPLDETSIVEEGPEEGEK